MGIPISEGPRDDAVALASILRRRNAELEAANARIEELERLLDQANSDLLDARQDVRMAEDRSRELDSAVADLERQMRESQSASRRGW